MTCPRHVPQAPTSYAAGRTVRLVRAVHRWAVSGTPMEAGRLADIRHLINFVAGEASQLEAVWRRAAEGGRLGEMWPGYGRDTVVALGLGQARGRGWSSRRAARRAAAALPAAHQGAGRESDPRAQAGAPPRDQPRSAEVSRDQPRSVDMQPRSAEVSRGQPRSAERDQPRSAEASRSLAEVRPSR